MRVTLRPHPFPYRATLAICSDLDETPTRAVYEDTARFLNTTQAVGKMGEGVGLEVGNSLYFDMPREQFSYWNTDDSGREMLRRLIRSGHIDCFHSYGDHATTRAHVGRALDDLARHGCSMGVWIDHAVAATNFGADIMQGHGDVVGHEAYHADLTCGAGVRYVWRGRVTSVIGQDVPRRLGGIFDPEHGALSAKTVAKEWVKGWLGRLGNEKYSIHPGNGILRPASLRDGRAVWEFLRANPYWEAVDRGETAAGLAGVVTPRMLESLVARGGSQILYTHLGKVKHEDEPLQAPTRGALRLLAEAHRGGRILVTTTRRLLDHARALRECRVAVDSAADRGPAILIDAPADLAAGVFGDGTCGLDGLTIYVEKPGTYAVAVNSGATRTFETNPADETGRPSISLPRPKLVFS